MTPAEDEKANPPKAADGDEEWIRPRLDEVVKVIGPVEPNVSSQIEGLITGDFSHRQLRASELSAIARNLLSLMGESARDE